MFEQIVTAITDYPYWGVAILFLLCGMGLPLPEEVVLLAAGYICAKFPDHASLPLMMGWCAGAILAGDLLPFVLGRVFGVRLLRLRWLRLIVTRQRLASFDRWFRLRGDWVILIARFLPGLRVVAFFTAGTMKMPWRRFLCLDGLGIAMIVPLLTWLGYHSAAFIERAVAMVQKLERGLLWGLGAAVVAGLLWWWLRQRRLRRERSRPTEAFVQPQLRVQPTAPAAGTEAGGGAAGAGGAGAGGAAASGDAPPPPTTN